MRRISYCCSCFHRMLFYTDTKQSLSTSFTRAEIYWLECREFSAFNNIFVLSKRTSFADTNTIQVGFGEHSQYHFVTNEQRSFSSANILNTPAYYSILIKIMIINMMNIVIIQFDIVPDKHSCEQTNVAKRSREPSALFQKHVFTFELVNVIR